MRRSQRKRPWATLCVVLGLCALAGGVAACGSSDEDSGTGTNAASGTTTTGAAKKKVHFALLDEGTTSFTGPENEGVKAGADKVGATFDRFSADHDPQKQLTQCQNAIASGKYQGIVIYAVDNAAAVACAKQAENAEIPVVAMNQTVGPKNDSTEIQVPGVKAQIILPLTEDVKWTTELVKQACAQDEKPPCRVVKTVSIPAYAYCSYKLKHEIPIYKERGYDVVATPTIGNFDDRDNFVRAIKGVLSKTQDIDVIVSDDDSSVQGAVQMKKEGELPKKTLIIGNGGSKPAIQSIKDGYQFGTYFDVPHSIGERAAELVAAVVRGEKIDKPAQVQSDINPHPIVTKENVEEVTAQW